MATAQGTYRRNHGPARPGPFLQAAVPRPAHLGGQPLGALARATRVCRALLLVVRGACAVGAVVLRSRAVAMARPEAASCSTALAKAVAPRLPLAPLSIIIRLGTQRVLEGRAWLRLDA